MVNNALTTGSNTVKSHFILVYLCRYTIKLLLTKSSVPRVWFILRVVYLERKTKYFLVLTSPSVDKSILPFLNVSFSFRVEHEGQSPTAEISPVEFNPEEIWILTNGSYPLYQKDKFKHT